MKLSDPYNTQELRSRSFLLAGVFVVLLGLLLVRLWYLQIWRGEDYRLFSDKNRFRIDRISAPRGQVLDRNGNLLADNRPRFDLVFTRGYTTRLDDELQILGKILKWTPEDVADKKDLLSRSPNFQPRRLARDINWDQLSQIESRALDLTGSSIEVSAVRDYLYGDAFFHIVGYTGEINDVELRELRERFPERNYRLGDQLGQKGTESLYERFLRGVDGREFTVVDVKGRPVERTGLKFMDQNTREEAVAGKTIQLSLDLELQLETIQAFGSNRGAAVAMDPRTGEILAMVSRPALDANIFTRQITVESLKELQSREDKPFLDRTLGEHYPPGSVYKIVMSAAALENGVITKDTSFYCPGFFKFGRRIWKCHKHEGHGRVNLHEAFKQSCDVYFYNVGLMLGLQSMYEWSRKFGLGRRTWLGHEVFEDHFPLPRLYRFNSEQTGFIPNPDWVLDTAQSTIEAETINAGIGQGGFLTTVTQLARMMSLFMNGGKVFQPQLVKAIIDAETGKREGFTATLENQISLHPETTQELMAAMKGTVNEVGGTAIRSKVAEFTLGGKTGTSQVVSLTRIPGNPKFAPAHLQDHALFAGAAPLEDPKIVVAVLVENGGSGGHAAAPIGKLMTKNYLLRQMAKTEVAPEGNQRK